MQKTRWYKFCGLVTVLVTFLVSGSVAQELSPKEIIQRNIDASGGREKLSQVQNFSFITGNTKAVASASGDLKLITGKEPVITEVILVKGGRVRKNSFQKVTDVDEPQKTIHLTLGKLYAGLFSLLKFEGELKSEGVKSYGPERLYHLTLAKPGAVRVDFYLRTDDFRLKRLVFQGSTAEGERLEINYDFPPFEDIEELTIPPSWFVSQVGTRGNLLEISAVKKNIPLPEGFFETLEVNMGKVEVSAGHLRGNVLDTSSSRFSLTITTNFTSKDIETAGLRTGDQLSFVAGGEEHELVFYSSARELPSRGELARGARLMTILPWGGETYVIQFFGGDWSQMAAKLSPLAPVEIKKK